MKRNKNDMIMDIDIAIQLLTKAKDEINKCPYEEFGTCWDGEWSAEKVKRNCITARQLVLDVKKGCENLYS